LHIFEEMKRAVFGAWAIEEVFGLFRAECPVLGANPGAGVAFKKLLFAFPCLYGCRRADQVSGLAIFYLTRDFLHPCMRADNARHRVFIRDGERGQPEQGSPVDIFLRMAGAGQEGEVRGDGELGKAHERFFPVSLKTSTNLVEEA